MRTSLILLPFLVLLFTGCIGGGTQPQPAANGAPQWLYNPSAGGKLGGVGSAKTHIKGRSAQRQLAISRALDEIARQMGVKVSNVLTTEAHADQHSASSSMSSYSFQTTDGKVVTAQIKEMWYDAAQQELHVWMVVQ